MRPHRRVAPSREPPPPPTRSAKELPLVGPFPVRRSALVGLSLFLVVACATSTVGCATKLRNKELEAVAKDWSMVIRASQVIPVYPLTEDLQVGDVFLVQVPIDRQQDVYRQRGFLPLDNLVLRVNPAGYLSFYRRSFGVGDEQTPLPKHWLKPGAENAWGTAPKATFPSYSFSVRSGGGFNVAVPVQGVPVGLSLLGGGAAAGTITIADARTYGVDTVSLHEDVVRWARDSRSFLQNFASDADRRNYLRVVSRVYLAGTLNVSLQSTRNVGATASGGAPKPVPLDNVVPTPGADVSAVTLDSYKKNVATLNGMIEEALKVASGANQILPGGTVKIVSASAGSISLNETFARPLVIGYLGFDIPILAGGKLGSPIPTHAVLEGRVGAGGSTVFEPDTQLRSGSLLIAVYQVLGRRNDAEAKALTTRLDALARRLPERYPCTVYQMSGPQSLKPREGASAGDQLRAQNFRGLVEYRGDLATSLNNLRLALANPKIAVAGHAPRTVATDEFLRGEIARTEGALKQVNDLLAEQNPLIREAADAAAASQE